MLWIELCLLKIHMLKPSLHCDGIWKQGLWEIIRFWWGYESGTIKMGSVHLWEDTREFACSCPHLPAMWRHRRRWLSAGRKQGSHQKPAVMTLWSRTSQHQNCKKWTLLFKPPSIRYFVMGGQAKTSYEPVISLLIYTQEKWKQIHATLVHKC